MADVEVNGVRLEYAEQGTGQPVVFVHGGTADLRIWANQLDEFSSQYRAIALSCRHYYPNEEIPDDEDLPLETLVEDLAAFQRTLHLQPAHFVGHSSPGGFACLLLARTNPSMVRTLVLAEPPALPLLGVGVPPKPLQILRLLIRNPRAGIAAIEFGARGIGPASRAFERGDDRLGLETFMNAILGHQAFAKLSQARLQQALENVRPLKAQLRAGFPPFGDDDARRISVPTLLVTGEHSAPILHQVIDRLEKLIPNVERVQIKGASHVMFKDDPGAFNREVLAFLDQRAD